MDITLNCVRFDLMWILGRLNCLCSRLSEDMCVVPSAPTVTMTVEGTFQPLLHIFSRGGVYFVVFCWNFSNKNLSLV